MMTPLISIACVAAWALSAPEPDALTITGTPAGVTVTEPGGAVEHYRPGQLQLLNQELASGTRRPGTEEAPAEADGTETEEPQPEAVEEAPSPPEPEVKELTPEQLAQKQAAIAAIQAARQLGGAYFYTEDGRPISGPELSRMIESGDVPNINVVDLFQQRRVYDFKTIEEGDSPE